MSKFSGAVVGRKSSVVNRRSYDHDDDDDRESKKAPLVFIFIYMRDWISKPSAIIFIVISSSNLPKANQMKLPNPRTHATTPRPRTDTIAVNS